ncbi:hypothetical protein [Mesorhizobium muleiense]|uniref:hypothetical protein n=1 Tax=Mesorhizobium muleiense TaxID=1004279 RepID=UPI000B8848B5|nr:hypothetical protein [Mesorhizobium muleiense]MCF6102402.1 hypothetical protein [Mesorhizobium muleiense]
MTEAQRKDAISDAFKPGDKMVFGAILRMPHYASGNSKAYLEISGIVTGNSFPGPIRAPWPAEKGTRGGRRAGHDVHAVR